MLKIILELLNTVKINEHTHVKFSISIFNVSLVGNYWSYFLVVMVMEKIQNEYLKIDWLLNKCVSHKIWFVFV